MKNTAVEEIKRHFNVVAESLGSKIQFIAEGISTVDDKLERHRKEIKEEFNETKSMIKFSFTELDRRINAIESEVSLLKK